MMNINRKQLFAVAVSLVLPLTAFGASVRDQASAVVVGEVLSGQQTGNSALFRLSVIRTLKGDLTPGVTLSVNASLHRRVNRDLTGKFGMWFLEKTGIQWILLPLQPRDGIFDTAYYPFSKASSPAAIPTRSLPSTLDEKIALELAAGLQSYSSPLQFQLLAHGLLAATDSSVVQDAFQSLHTSSDPELRFISLARSLRNKNDISALAEIANNIELASSLKATFFLTGGLLGRLDSDPAAIACLGKIATSSDRLRGAATIALMHIHTRETLPFLAKMLDSSDPPTREYAMRGLSRFVDNLPVATQENVVSGRASLRQDPTPYRTPDTDRYSLATRSLPHTPESEAAFLRFWKSWWATMKDTLAK